MTGTRSGKLYAAGVSVVICLIVGKLLGVPVWWQLIPFILLLFVTLTIAVYFRLARNRLRNRPKEMFFAARPVTNRMRTENGSSWRVFEAEHNLPFNILGIIDECRRAKA